MPSASHEEKSSSASRRPTTNSKTTKPFPRTEGVALMISPSALKRCRTDVTFTPRLSSAGAGENDAR
jgi:hypothetical protein